MRSTVAHPEKSFDVLQYMKSILFTQSSASQFCHLWTGFWCLQLLFRVLLLTAAALLRAARVQWRRGRVRRGLANPLLHLQKLR